MNWPSGYGAANGALTDTFYAAVNNALYFAALPYTPTSAAPTAAPTQVSGDDDDDDDDDDDNSSTGEAVTAVFVATFVPCIFVMGGMLAYFCMYWGPKSATPPMATTAEKVNEI